jgi:glycosyltransferase involved in cell wall biosynthesis
MRYAWDFYHPYLKAANLTKGFKARYAKKILHKLRLWDVVSSNRVDYFIANSNYIAKRIKKIYRREATVIYPPVDIESFTLNEQKENYYFTASRLVSYKKIDLVVKAFAKMPNKKLIVVGYGPDLEKIRKIATKNIEIIGEVSKTELINYMQKAKAFVFPAEEDFGIIPVEAQACGTPVIAYRKGGCLETVIENKTGIFFNKQTTSSIIDAIAVFEKTTFNYKVIRKNAERFCKKRFEKEFSTFVENKIVEFNT